MLTFAGGWLDLRVSGRSRPVDGGLGLVFLTGPDTLLYTRPGPLLSPVGRWRAFSHEKARHVPSIFADERGQGQFPG